MRLGDGGYAVAATQQWDGEAHGGFWLAKANANREWEWAYNYYVGVNCQCLDLAETEDGSLWLAGWAYYDTCTTRDAFCMKIDADGNFLWMRNYPEQPWLWGRMNSIVAVGNDLAAFGNYSAAARLWYLNGDGDTLWTKSYSFRGLNRGYSICTLPIGGYAMGLTAFDGDDPPRAFIMRTNVLGDSLWSIASVDEAGEVDVAVAGPEGMIALVSYAGHAMRLIRAANSGGVYWEIPQFFPDNTNLTLPRVCTTLDHGYVISADLNWASHTYVARYDSDPTLHAPDFTPHPSSFSISAYPNPFNSFSTLTLEMPHAIDARVILYDITGRQVLEIAQQRFHAGEHSFTLDASALASGVYFVSLTSETPLAIQKLLLLK